MDLDGFVASQLPALPARGAADEQAEREMINAGEMGFRYVGDPG